MSIEPQWLVIISLLQMQHKNEYDSTVTMILVNDTVDQQLKNPIEVKDGIFFESPRLRSLIINEIWRNRNVSLWWSV